MLKIWRKRIGAIIKERRGDVSQDAYATEHLISRTQLSDMERGVRNYQLDPLLKILVDARDPVAELLRISGRLNGLSETDVEAVYLVVGALSDSDERARRYVRSLIETLKVDEEIKKGRKEK